MITMNQEELIQYFHTTESYVRTNFPKFCKKQLAQGYLIKKRGKYPNAEYDIEEVQPEEKDISYFSTRLNKNNNDLENEKWITCKIDNRYEVSNMGRFRNAKTKEIQAGSKTKEGYVRISFGASDFGLLHRAVLSSFNPIDNMDEMTVDHINGIRDDNRLENLQWVSMEDNILFMMKNRKELNQELTRLIQKYGYEGTLQKLRNMI